MQKSASQAVRREPATLGALLIRLLSSAQNKCLCLQPPEAKATGAEPPIKATNMHDRRRPNATREADGRRRHLCMASGSHYCIDQPAMAMANMPWPSTNYKPPRQQRPLDPATSGICIITSLPGSMMPTDGGGEGGLTYAITFNYTSCASKELCTIIDELWSLINDA